MEAALRDLMERQSAMRRLAAERHAKAASACTAAGLAPDERQRLQNAVRKFKKQEAECSEFLGFLRVQLDAANPGLSGDS